MADRVIPEGAKFLKPKSVCARFDRGHSWLWAKLKSDPDFPRPYYLDPKAPLFLESELDAYISARAKAAV